MCRVDDMQVQQLSNRYANAAVQVAKRIGKLFRINLLTTSLGIACSASQDIVPALL